MKTRSSYYLVILLLMSSCVQEVHLKKVTLSVDMNEIENVDVVTVRGDFTSPPWSQEIELSDTDDDGVFQITLERETAQFGMTFKFLRNGQYELEGQPNRELLFEYQPETITYKAEFDNPTAHIIKK